ncbi:MAG: UDP-N-acetylmuramoyl-tripeptide--D-alanyl-D-alanine ligase [Planctomycetes bacterium]|nr:UDP-N-acetylmuramoyl-tripeptide--D-alanyl-D-alanine ligase [Planctomycetota bacterium]MCB9871025.1 UDP-N-acetylmuramoyl-tripeptide--D-alanyl-D-alanine ligase [Planctomycetota bacterium]
MMPTELATRLRGDRRALLAPAHIAEVCAGRVLRRGNPAGRVVTDSRELRAGDCFVALPGEKFDGHTFLSEAFARGAAGAVVCRPVSRNLLCSGAFVVRVEDTFAALLRLAQDHRRQHRAKVVGITGSCGKTSTKDMLWRVLERVVPTIGSPKSFNNHIGVPLTLFHLRPETEVAVVEMGTSGPGEIARLAEVVQPDIGIVTRIDESHLMRLGSVEGVAYEKSRLVAALREDGLAILNGDDPRSPLLRAATRARTVEVRLDREADWFATDLSFHGLGTSFRLQGETPVTLPHLGSHNVYNALFTIAAASELGVPLDDILAGLCEAPLSARRLERKQLGDVVVIDDTYNANPASAKAGLRAVAGLPVKGRRLVALGEMLELGPRSLALHSELGEAVAEAGIDVLIAVGEGAQAIAEAALAAGMPQSAVHRTSDAHAALELLRGELRAGDTLLCKASRAVGLERLVDGLAAQYAAAPMQQPS